MSSVEGLSTPLVEVPPSPIHSPVPEASEQLSPSPPSIDPDRWVAKHSYNIVLSSAIFRNLLKKQIVKLFRSLTNLNKIHIYIIIVSISLYIWFSY